MIDPVDVLLDLAAAERALWSWWAGYLDLPVNEVARVARSEPLPSALRALREQTGDSGQVRDEADIALVAARRTELHRLVRRRRGAASLLRSIPAGRVAIWTTLESDELAELERRVHLTLPPDRRCGVSVADDGGAVSFLAEHGGSPEDWLALESHSSGAQRSARIGCQVVVVDPELVRGGSSSDASGSEWLSVEDPALLSITPVADGLLVGVRRQTRLLPER